LKVKKAAGDTCGFCISATITAFPDQVNIPIIRVALDIPLSTLFDYTVADGIAVATGQRVIVPLWRRQMVGVAMECVAATEMAPEHIKPVKQVLHDSAPLSAELLDLLRFCSDYYCHPIVPTVLAA